jgi:small subunit ribosomal protein S24e
MGLFLQIYIEKGMQMKVEVVKKEENPLLKRTEIEFKVEHKGAPTPKRLEVKAALASALGVPEEVLVIEKLASSYGSQTASGIARAYSTREHLEALEPSYLLVRGMPREPKQKPEEAKQEKPAEKKPEAKEKATGGDAGGKGS